MACREKPARHPIYYFPDGSILLLLAESNVLYRIFQSVLARASGCFDTMLSLKAEDPLEGKDDQHPIIIPQISQRDFDYLMGYIIDNDFPEGNEEGLIALLNLTTFYDMNRHREKAKAALLRLTDFRPALQYHLGIKNSIPEWTESGFRKLVDLPFESLLWTDIERMGLEAFTTVIQTKHAIEQHRKRVAFWPAEPVLSPTCSYSIRCSVRWKGDWWNKVAKHLLHPDVGDGSSLQGAALVEALENVEIDGMCSECKALTMAKVKESGVLTWEDTLVADVVQRILS